MRQSSLEIQYKTLPYQLVEYSNELYVIGSCGSHVPWCGSTPPGVPARPPGVAACLPGTVARPPGVAARLPGVAARPPGVAARPPGVAARPPGTVLTGSQKSPFTSPQCHPDEGAPVVTQL